MFPPIRSDRQWDFDLTPRQLWQQLSTTDRYSDWWPWLRTFDPDRGFVAGARWQCQVSPPLPYVVRFEVELHEVDAPSVAAARVTGDVEGTARLTISATTRRTCRARLVSELAPHDTWLRLAGLMARPVVRWGHDWVLDRGREQFLAHLDP